MQGRYHYIGKQRAIQMNFKKAVLVFLAVSLILDLGFSVALYGNFKDRTDQWESAYCGNCGKKLSEDEDVWWMGSFYGKKNGKKENPFVKCTDGYRDACYFFDHKFVCGQILCGIY